MAEKTNRKSTPRYKSQMEPHDEESWKSRFGPKDAGYECGHSPKSPAHHRAFPQTCNRRAKSSLSCGSPDVNTSETSPSDKHRGQRRSPADRKNWRDRPRDGHMHGDDMQNFKEVNTFVSIDCCLIKADIFQLFMEAGNRVGESGHSKERRVPILGFKCEKCEVYYWDMAQAFSHIRERSHRNKAKELQRQKILMNIPAPGSAQCDLISSAIERVVTEFGLNDQDLNQRQNILSVIETVLRPVLPECQFRLYGSSLTKLGFKNSDVNIDVKFPSTFQHPDVLLLAKEHLSRSDLFVDVFGDFHRRPPLVVCTEKSSGLICRVSAGNESACWTTEYLAELTSLEPRIIPLIICFRHWARICHVDNMGEGGIPSYCFALMVISFLQRCKEPVLPSYLESASLPVSKLKSFSITGVKQGNVLWVIDPSSSSQDKERVVTRGMAPLVFEDRSRPWSLGKLWVDLLRYYTVEFQIQRKVISVRTNGDLWRDLKDWPKNRIAIEDPFAVQGNVARTMNSQLMFYYMLHCLRTTYKYFASPAKLPAKKKGLNLSHGGEPEPSVFQSDSETQKGSTNVASSLDGAEQLEDSDCIIELEMDVEEEAESDVESEAEQEEDEDEDDDDDDKNELAEVDGSGCDHSGDEIFSFDDELSENAADTQAEVDSQDASPDTHPGFKYVFNKQVFSNGKPHVLVCSLCNSDGHLKQDCPDDFKPEKLRTLPVLTLDFLNTLNDVCEQCYSDFSPDDLEDKVREHVRQEFEIFLRFHIPGAKLTLFGSSKNGFGFKQSDLDICMTLEGQDTAMGLDFMSIFESLTDVLNKHSGLRNVQPITSAKVPIVKFYHNKSGLEGDISLYNTLPLHNTELLASYAAIDDRVKILCYVMKVFAKVCDIGDASRGSLSSYAYTLMVLYFLQQRKPPVIPVLQEISDGESKQAMLVDGWDVQFFKDLKNLHRCWPDYRKNKESVGELWLGLLQFYTEMFDFKEYVICIRRKEPLTTLKKQWTSKHLSIEDPFDLSHNLGGGLSRKMANFIIKAFINARTVFGSPVQIFPAVYSNKMEYFFDPDVLTEGKLAPNDRCCRFCGKVGHFMKECPIQKKKPTKAMREHGSYKDKWVREKEERSCFLCGSSSHMKRDCQLSGSLDSPCRQSPASTRAKHGSPQRDGTKRHKVKKVILGPEHGSLVNRHGSFMSPVQGGSPFRGKRESKSVED